MLSLLHNLKKPADSKWRNEVNRSQREVGALTSTWIKAGSRLRPALTNGWTLKYQACGCSEEVPQLVRLNRKMMIRSEADQAVNVRSKAGLEAAWKSRGRLKLLEWYRGRLEVILCVLGFMRLSKFVPLIKSLKSIFSLRRDLMPNLNPQKPHQSLSQVHGRQAKKIKSKRLSKVHRDRNYPQEGRFLQIRSRLGPRIIHLKCKRLQ